MDYKTLKKVLRQYRAFASYVSQGHGDTIPLENGEEICFYDLLNGFDELPLKQRQAVLFHVIFDLDGDTCARILGYDTKAGRTTVTTNALRGLKKMAECHNKETDGQHR